MCWAFMSTSASWCSVGWRATTQMGWVFVDGAQTALDGVNAGDYYAALDPAAGIYRRLRQYSGGRPAPSPDTVLRKREKERHRSPKITSKAKTAVQEQINTTILEKVADALTTAGSVFKAMGLDGRDIADGLLEKLSAASGTWMSWRQVLRSLQDVMGRG